MTTKRADALEMAVLWILIVLMTGVFWIGLFAVADWVGDAFR
jgi:hypothetical protein